MRFKPVPEPPADRSFLATVRRALPATAGDVDDCCRHLVTETPLTDRDEAATWLTFLRALELATAEPAGFRRRDSSPDTDSDAPDDLDRDDLGGAFRARVYGADRALAALERADRPLTADEVAGAIREERRSDERRPRPKRGAASRRERVERLLGWAVLLGLAEKTGDGYRIAPARE